MAEEWVDLATGKASVGQEEWQDLATGKKVESPSILKSLGVGAVKGISDIYTGGAQLLNKAGIVSDEYLKKLESERKADTEKYKPELESTAGKVGQFAGETAITLPIGGGATGGFLRRLMTSGAGGAAIGALQPTEGDQSHLMNASKGALLGVGGQAVMSGAGKAINAVTGKVPQTKTAILSEKWDIPITKSEELTGKSSRADVLLERFPWIFGNKSLRGRQLGGSEEASKNLLARYTVDPQGSTAAMKEANDRYLDVLYETVRQSGKALPAIAATEVKKSTGELLQEFPDVFKSIQSSKIKGILNDIAGDVADKTKTSPILNASGKPITSTVTPEFDFGTLWMLRRGLGAEIGSAKDNIARGELKKLYHAVSDDMDTMFSKAGGKEGKIFKQANEEFKRVSLKFDLLREAYDAAERYKKGELFSPAIFSTKLAKLANDPNYKKNVKWSPDEIEEMTGLANILQVAKRGAQHFENPPTGNRYGALTTAGVMEGAAYKVGGIATAMKTAGLGFGVAGIAKFLTATEPGKALSMAASKIEPNSPQMKKIIDKLYSIAPKMAAISGTAQETGE